MHCLNVTETRSISGLSSSLIIVRPRSLVACLPIVCRRGILPDSSPASASSAPLGSSSPTSGTFSRCDTATPCCAGSRSSGPSDAYCCLVRNISVECFYIVLFLEAWKIHLSFISAERRLPGYRVPSRFAKNTGPAPSAFIAYLRP